MIQKTIFLRSLQVIAFSSAVIFSAVSANAQTIADENQVEIALSDKLDGVTNHYCIDIAGGNKNIDITKGLQVHTCYSYQGSLGSDQVFDKSEFDNNKLYMPNYDVCATASALTAGSSIGLASCEDGNELQTISFENGKFSPVAAPNMCVTAAQDTRFGRSDKHQIKKLSLEMCSDDLAPYQTWRGRTEQD